MPPTDKTMTAYFVSHHQTVRAMAAVKMDIATDVAISFVHSQYDKQVYSQSAACRTAMTFPNDM